jgi:hypothetical protein
MSGPLTPAACTLIVTWPSVGIASVDLVMVIALGSPGCSTTTWVNVLFKIAIKISPWLIVIKM